LEQLEVFIINNCHKFGAEAANKSEENIEDILASLFSKKESSSDMIEFQVNLLVDNTNTNTPPGIMSRHIMSTNCAEYK
jgi:hypothetical protein